MAIGDAPLLSVAVAQRVDLSDPSLAVNLSDALPLSVAVAGKNCCSALSLAVGEFGVNLFGVSFVA